MAHGQFIIPEAPHLSSSEQIRHDVDAIFEDLEHQAELVAPYAAYKEIEADIEAMRNSMTEADAPRWVK